MSLHIPSLYLAPSDIHDRGMFTYQAIEAGNAIEVCPVVVFSKKERGVIHNTILHGYYFTWGEDDQSGAIALGYGSMYNHSFQPNARFLVDFEMETISIRSIKDIAAGEEITINYNGDPEDQTPLWFSKKSE